MPNLLIIVVLVAQVKIIPSRMGKKSFSPSYVHRYLNFREKRSNLSFLISVFLLIEMNVACTHKNYLMTFYPRIDPENAQVDTMVRLLGPGLVLGRTEAKSARK